MVLTDRQWGGAVWVGALLSIVLGFVSIASGDASPAASNRPCSGWSAVLNQMPGPNVTPTLSVKGACTFMAAGYKVELKKHAPQGINPAILLLDIIIHQGIGAQVPTKVQVNYTLKTNTKYTNVTLLPDNVTIPVKIVR